ncbi:MAG: methyltransferase domain-containing protein [Archaeoglobus sp.]|uniref:class I SAM-dependent methyltransferase n=1 Tax=Archaeoglobus sp. TaxID=1872626 RepID=UPI001DD60FCD|nr:class I SAM-dependent methyltransferase [Archaeoglobus sp.]MBO8180457.1 methyltransferase domain-containing protein [Archaeoglobus sp.]
MAIREVEKYAWNKKRRAVYNCLRMLDKKRGIRLLDIGCNNGGQLVEYSKLLEGELLGIDIKKFGEWNFLNYDFIVGDARKLPFKDGVFDIVVATEVIEHFVEGELFLAEVYRVLKQNGFLILTTPNRLRFYMLHKNIAAALTRRRFVSGFTHEHPREYSLKELASILENTGFRMERAEYIAFSPYLGIPFRLYRLLDDFSNRFLEKFLKWDVIVVARKS